ncbi:hypothetical protein JD844_011013 [Phrynosoma platyrhinos]|uniref:peptidylprolyl isomerase n=1 Tax=Phrynosoma platyrhinos TaxID=52577 RepID=A0ABQ7THR0_PHRPL|nr:hypothetical protein JD844_011013 [Phrynosoma platyrhinos]
MLPRLRILCLCLLLGCGSRAQPSQEGEGEGGREGETPLRTLQLETLQGVFEMAHSSGTCLEQGLLDMCVGEKRRVTIPPHLAYGKRGSPPAIPADAVLQFEVELVGLSRASYWQKIFNDVLPLVCIGLVPALLGLIGYYLYKKAQTPRVSKKKLKEEKRNKAKRK